MQTTTQANVKQPPLDLVNSAFLVLTPIIAVFGTGWYAYRNGVTWLEIGIFVLMFLCTGLSITAGYHRYYAHRSYDCNKALQLFYLIFGAAAVQNSVVAWASDHRRHHQFVDTDDDPYNILRGGLYAHMGWIFYKNERKPAEKFKCIPDLLKDPLVVWQHDWYLALVLLASFALPTYIGLLQGRPMGGLLWGGFLRVVVVHHMTFFINSLAHMWGSRPYSEQNTARDNWMLAPLTFGEGYHNFHHAFPADHRNGIRWYQFDITKWWLHAFNWVGFTWNLRRAHESSILMAKLKVQMNHVQRRYEQAGVSPTLWDQVQTQLQYGRKRLEAAVMQYQHAKAEYRRQKVYWSTEARRQWRHRVALYKKEFVLAKLGWQDTLRAMYRFPRPSAQGLLTFTALLDVFRMRNGL
jgi:stearoyl-CoA desaturase (delta-9 desaturase)